MIIQKPLSSYLSCTHDPEEDHEYTNRFLQEFDSLPEEAQSRALAERVVRLENISAAQTRWITVLSIAVGLVALGNFFSQPSR